MEWPGVAGGNGGLATPGRQDRKGDTTSLAHRRVRKMGGLSRLAFREQDLLGLAARGWFPIEGAVHDLAHLAEPPVGALKALLTLHDARAAICGCQAQFQLFLFCHIHDTFRCMA